MKNIKSILLATTFLGIASSLIASQMRLESDPGIPGLTPSGESLTAAGAGTFTFTLGGFDGFVPTAANFAEWGANWNSANISASWQVSGPFANRFRFQGGLQNASLVGQQGYIWGYDSQADLTTGQWILVTNPNWVFPAINALELPNDIAQENVWGINDEGNIAILGSFINGNPAEGFQLAAVPEPSTYALIFGLGILGFLGYRRVRK